MSLLSFTWHSISQIHGADILGSPLIVSEQYPKGLGSTVPELDISAARLVFPKTKFSMILPEVEKVLATLPLIRAVVLFGVEVRLEHFSALSELRENV